MSPSLLNVQRGKTPLIVSMPHSGTYLPAEIRARMTAPGQEVPDTDWFIPELYAFVHDLGATVIGATHSRYVVDLNRPPDGAPLYPGRRETGVCPVETFDGEALYAPGDEPTQDEVVARLQHYWHPYHVQLTALIAELVERHGRCILWDAHSIHSTVPAVFEGRLPDLNIGTADGRSCTGVLQQRLVAMLTAQQLFSFVVNGRFKGGYITRHYGRPQTGVDAVQLEIAQAAYLSEARTPRFDAARAAPLAGVIQQMLSEILREA